MVCNYVKRYAELKYNALEVRIKSLTITKLKYKCIRCLCDDLTNDAACVTLDQCLNCSRYEPIEGQVYEIMHEDLRAGEAQIFDDVQASYMTKKDFVELNRIEEMNIEDDTPEIDLSETTKRDESDKDATTLLKEANNFVMDWQRKPWDYESPHINIYDYNFTKIGLDKENRLDPANKYEDGWRTIEQYKYERPDYGVNILGSGINNNGYTYNTTNTVSLYFNLNDYDIDSNDIRFKIVQYAKEACEYCKKSFGFQYTFGAKIIPSLRLLTPDKLVAKAVAGEEVSTGKQANDTIKAVYTDCSNFTNYIYFCASNGRFDIPGTTTTIYQSDKFKVIGKGKELLQAIKEAIPGDLILYKGVNSGHVAIYVGGDECCEAYYDAEDKSIQVSQNKLKNKSDFVGIYRWNELSEPKLKNITFVNVKETLGSWVKNYQCGGSKNTLDSNDNNYTSAGEKILKYVDPLTRMNDELKCQFMLLKTSFPDSYVTEAGLNRFFKKKNRLNDMAPASAWIEAGKQSGINPIFLIAHSALESTWNSSKMMSGGTEAHVGASGKKIFNAYGLWCYNSDSGRLKAIEECDKRGWWDKSTAVIEGAKYIAQQYLSQEQEAKYGMRNTCYFMKWVFGSTIEGNPGEAGTMQYASDITWADQRAKIMYEIMTFLDGGVAEGMKYARFLIPVFKANNSGK